jgi:F-box interacting protein
MEIPSMFVGSCNGLLCFLSLKPLAEAEPFNYLLHISNPATRTRSQNFEFTFGHRFMFTFGYDASTRTYKVVAFRAEENSEVKVFNLGDNCWRNIQNFPNNRLVTKGVHFYSTINWLALDKSINGVYRLVIVSLDLSTETYKQFLLPLGFYEDEVPFSQPVLRVLMDSLCFYHDSNKTEFILWKMKEYGVQDSWTQLFKISYQHLAMQIGILLPMDTIDQLVCLYVNGDIVVFASTRWKPSFIYNLKDKTVVKIESKNTTHWLSDTKDYVESLVSVH